MTESILSRLTTFLRGSFKERPVERLGVEVERRAKRIHERTNLSRNEAVVVAADLEGFTTEEIGISVGKCDRTIEGIRRNVRRKRREGEIHLNTRDVLEEWADERGAVTDAGD